MPRLSSVQLNKSTVFLSSFKIQERESEQMPLSLAFVKIHVPKLFSSVFLISFEETTYIHVKI